MESTAASEDLTVRLPQQARSRAVWNRVLEAGVAIIEDGGYAAFTIAAVCSRAEVAPPTLYARTTSKDALFLAVYDHGIARLLADQQVFVDPSRWTDRPPAELVRSAVAEVVGITSRHRRFLGAVVLISGAHPEVRRRGSEHGAALGRGFAQALQPALPSIRHADPAAAVRACFGTVFAAAILRVAYGPGFATPVPVDDATFTADLGETAVRYLLLGADGTAPTAVDSSGVVVEPR